MSNTGQNTFLFTIRDTQPHLQNKYFQKCLGLMYTGDQKKYLSAWMFLKEVSLLLKKLEAHPDENTSMLLCLIITLLHAGVFSWNPFFFKSMKNFVFMFVMAYSFVVKESQLKSYEGWSLKYHHSYSNSQSQELNL